MKKLVIVTYRVIFPLMLAIGLICAYPISIFFTSPVKAQIPQFINYQGKLKDGGGVPLSGTYDFRMRIYDDLTAGSLLYAEEQLGVTVKTGGIFDVQVGTGAVLNPPNNSFSTLDFTVPYYLSVEVGQTGVWDGEMSPRVALATYMYAFNASRLDGHSAGTGADDVLLLDGSGDINFSGDIITPGNIESGAITISGAEYTAFLVVDDISNAVSMGIYVGHGTPDGWVAATPGSLFMDETGELFLKESGTGNTGWTNLATTGDLSAMRLWEDGTFGTYKDDAPVLITSSGDIDETIVNAGFSLSNGNLFVEGDTGVAGDVYTNGSFIAGSTLTMSDGSITQSASGTGDLTISTTGGTGGNMIVDTAGDFFQLTDYSSGNYSMVADGVDLYTAGAGFLMDPYANEAYLNSVDMGLVGFFNMTSAVTAGTSTQGAILHSANSDPDTMTRFAHSMVYETNQNGEVEARLFAGIYAGGGTDDALVTVESSQEDDGGDSVVHIESHKRGAGNAGNSYIEIEASSDDPSQLTWIEFQDNNDRLNFTQYGSAIGDDLLNSFGEIYESTGTIGSTIGAGETSNSLVHALNAVGTYVANIVTRTPVRNVVRVRSGATEIPGEMYSTIANAITYVNNQTPSSTNRWKIRVEDDSNPENFTVPQFTAVEGYGFFTHTTLTGNIVLSGSSSLENLTCENGTIDSSGSMPNIFKQVMFEGNTINANINTVWFFTAADKSAGSTVVNINHSGCEIAQGSPTFDGGINVNNGGSVSLMNTVVDSVTVANGGYLEANASKIEGDLTINAGGQVHTYATAIDGTVNDAGAWTNFANMYDNSTSGMAAVNTQDAIDELEALITSTGGTYFAQDGNAFGSLATLGSNDMFGLAFETGGVEAMRIDDNGRVGIGVVVPDYELEVAGDIGVDGYIYNNDDDNTYFQFMGTDHIRLRVGGERMLTLHEDGTQDYVQVGDGGDVDFYVKSSGDYDAIYVQGSDGRVGIGTNNPSAALDVHVSSGGAATIGSAGCSATANYAIAMGWNTTASGQYSTAIGYDTTASNTGATSIGVSTVASGLISTAMGGATIASGLYSTSMGQGIEAGANNVVAIGLNDQTGTNCNQANSMCIMGGNVGIGAITPDADLDIEAAENTEFLRFTDSTNSDSSGFFTGNATPEGVVTAQLGSLFLDNANGELYIKDTGDGTDTGWAQVATGAGIGNVEDGTVAGQMLFWDGINEYKHTETSELFWNDTNKNLGIGTNSPSYMLHTYKDQNAPTVVLMGENPNTGANAFAEFQLASSDTQLRLLALSTNYFDPLFADSVDILANNVSHLLFRQDTTGGDMRFMMGTNTHMVLDSLGNLGVGLDNPSSALQVAGSQLWVGNGGTVFFADGDGDLFVEDDIEVSDDIYLADRLVAQAQTNTYLDFAPTTRQILFYVNGIAMLNMQDWARDVFAVGNTSYDVDFTVATQVGEDSFLVEGNTGRVGIGTPTPITALHIDSNVANTTAILTLENTAGDFQVFRTDATPESSVVGSVGDLAMDGTNGALYIKESGNGTLTGWDLVATGAGVTAGNGLTLNGTVMELGGTIGAPTTIDGHNTSLRIDIHDGLAESRTQDAVNSGYAGFLSNVGTSAKMYTDGTGATQSSLEITQSAMTVTDGNSSKGLVYALDYSANFTDRSLVDKEYVDDHVGAVTWQGALDNQVGGGNSFFMNMPSYEIDDDGGSVKYEVKAGRDLSFDAPNFSFHLDDSINSFRFTDNRAGAAQVGVVYSGDYSANFVDRSLVDKGYVDDLVGASTFLDLTDTPAAYTTGSLLFTSGSAVTEDNANLFWDDTTNRLGIGTTSLEDRLHIAGGNVNIDKTYGVVFDSTSFGQIFLDDGTNQANNDLLIAADLGGSNSVHFVASDDPSSSYFAVSPSQVTVSAGGTLSVEATSGLIGGDIRLLEGNAGGSNYVGFRAPGSVAANVLWILPAADGGNGDALITDGAGNLSWSTVGSTSPWGSSGGRIYPANGGDDVDLGSAETLTLGSVDPGQVMFSGATRIVSGDNNLFWDDTNKRLGIGTTSPSNRLSIVGESTTGDASVASINMTMYDDTVMAAPTLQFIRSGGSISSPTAVQNDMGVGMIFGTGYDGSSYEYGSVIQMVASGNWTTSNHGSRINFLTTENGTTTPLERMRIADNGAITFNEAYTFPTADGTNGQVLQTNGSGVLSWADGGGGTLDQAYDSGGAGAGRQITADSGAMEITVSDTSSNAGLVINQNDITNNPNALQINHSGTGYGLYITEDEVNTDNIAARFSNTQAAAAAGNYITVDADGYGLVVGGTNAVAGGRGTMAAVDLNTSSYAQMWQQANDYVFQTGGAFGSVQNALTIANDGNAVFATDSDSTTNAYQFTNLGTGNSFVVYDESSDTTPFVINNSGFVGIGDATPSAALSVAGRIEQVDTGRSIFIGERAGVADDLSDNDNVFIGYYAGHQNSTGQRNSAIGYESFRYNTIGGQNVAHGHSSLYGNSAGSNNTAIGYGSLRNNGTGNNNTALGHGSLISNTGNSRSTAVGVDAMYYADDRTTGRDTYNTAVGYQALRGSATAANNTGQYNTAIGDRVLFNNTTGSNNTALGYYSLNNVTEGIQNTAVGYNTGLGLTTGDYNTILGANVTGLAADLSNNIIIADGQGNQRINVIGNGNVGIGINSPSNRLDVSGDIGALAQGSLRFYDADSSNYVAFQSPGTVSSNITWTLPDDDGMFGDVLQTNGIGTLSWTGNGGSALWSKSGNDLSPAMSGDSVVLHDGEDLSISSLVEGAVLFAGPSGRVSEDNMHLFWDNANDRLGIGDATPDYSLDVNGKIGINGVQTIYNAQAEDGFTGSLVIGDGGTSLSHTSGSEGYYNTFVGIGSGSANTTGHSNTASGMFSLHVNTTGNYNTAIGGYSLYDLTEGLRNIAIGHNTGWGITTGDNNTIIGSNVTGLAADLSNNIIIADGQGNQRLNVSSAGAVTFNQLYTFPTADGANEQILQTDGGGALSWVNAGSSPFGLTGAVVRDENGDYSNDDFVFGSPQLADDGDTDHDNRLFFDKSKAAFRAGTTSSSQWDDTNVGAYSIALGRDTTASGTSATALGYHVMASGDYSTAFGIGTTASQQYATAFGSGTTASGEYALVMGRNTTASGESSTAFGFDSTATGDFSTAMGYDTVASGTISTAIGQDSVASGWYSFTGGRNMRPSSGSATFVWGYAGSGQTFAPADNRFLIFPQGDAGMVGIGTVTPSTTLHVDSNSANTAAILTLENSAGDFQVFRTDTPPENAVTGSPGDLAMDSNNGIMYLKNTGSGTNTGWVQVATGSAGGNVEDGTTAGQMVFWDGSSEYKHTETSELFWDDTNQRIGIGTNAPIHTFQVSGDHDNGRILIHDTDGGVGDEAGLLFAVSGNLSTSPAKAGIFFNREAVYGRGDLIFAVDNTADASEVTDADIRMSIQSSGEVIVGTASPTHVSGQGSLFVDQYIEIGKGLYIYDDIVHSGDTDTSIGWGTDTVRINAGGVRMIDFIEGTSDSVVINELSVDVDFRVESNTNVNMLFVDAGNDRVGIGTNTPGSTFEIEGTMPIFTIDSGASYDAAINLSENGSVQWHIFNDGDNGDRLAITDNDNNQGVYLAQDATSWTANSDARLKENVATIDNALDSVLNMRGVKYNFIGTGKTEIGVIAQEVNGYFPEIVDTDGEYMGVSYSRIGPILIEAIKEQQIEVEDLGDMKADNELVEALGMEIDEVTGEVEQLDTGLTGVNGQIIELENRMADVESAIEELEGSVIIGDSIEVAEVLGVVKIIGEDGTELEIKDGSLYVDGEEFGTAAILPDDPSFESMTVVSRITAGEIVIGGNASVGGALVVTGDITAMAGLSVHGHISVGTDTAGEVVIPAGASEVEVIFDQPYADIPVVNVTAEDFFGGYAVSERSVNSFKIKLSEVAAVDVNFQWFVVEIE